MLFACLYFSNLFQTFDLTFFGPSICTMILVSAFCKASTCCWDNGITNSVTKPKRENRAENLEPKKNLEQLEFEFLSAIVHQLFYPEAVSATRRYCSDSVQSIRSQDLSLSSFQRFPARVAIPVSTKLLPTSGLAACLAAAGLPPYLFHLLYSQQPGSHWTVYSELFHPPYSFGPGNVARLPCIFCGLVGLFCHRLL